MFEYTWAKIHAGLNDLPAALLLTAVLFDLAGWALKRETLRAVMQRGEAALVRAPTALRSSAGPARLE